MEKSSSFDQNNDFEKLQNDNELHEMIKKVMSDIPNHPIERDDSLIPPHSKTNTPQKILTSPPELLSPREEFKKEKDCRIDIHDEQLFPNKCFVLHQTNETDKLLSELVMQTKKK